MTDDTVGPELPAARGGWTNGRARGAALPSGAGAHSAGLAGCSGKGAGPGVPSHLLWPSLPPGEGPARKPGQVGT